jgi:DNA replication protein DnaC
MTNTPEFKSGAEIADEYKERFDRIQIMTAKARETFDEWLALQDTSPIQCKNHPDVTCAVDRQATWETRRPWEIRRFRCRVCVENENLLHCGVPEVLVHARFENFEATDNTIQEHLETTQKFASQRSGFLVLVGSYGTGKSHLAVCVMRSFKRAIFIKQSTLLLKLRQTYRDRGAVDPVQLCQRAELLVLDEVGLSSGGRDELPLLHEILDYRYGHRKPTIITCNIPPEKLREVLGDRMVDRLKECCFAGLTFGGKSHRSAAKSRYFQDPDSIPQNENARYWWESEGPRSNPNI